MRRFLAWTLCATLCMGCSSNPSGDARDAGSAPKPGPPATLHGEVIFDIVNGVPNAPASNYPIGIVHGSARTTTDFYGGYSIRVPTNVPLLLLAMLDGEVPVQRLVVVPPGGERVDLHVLDIDAFVTDFERTGDKSSFSDFGVVGVRFEGSTLGGYGAKLSAAHAGSFVLLKGDFFDPVKSPSTRVAGDTLYFYGVAHGETSLTTTAPAGHAPCVDTFAPATVLYPVRAATMTEIVLQCP
jgi:hypothetical protein